MLVYNRDTLKIIAVNKAAREFYGYSEKYFLNLTFDNLQINKSQSNYPGISADNTGDDTNHIITVHTRKNGELVYVEITEREIQFSGQPSRQVVIIDVNERIKFEKELMEVEMKYKSLVENIGEGVVQADNDDKLLFINKRYCEMLGYRMDELIGKTGYEVLLDKEDHEIIKIKNSDRTRGLSDKYEMVIKKKDGTPVYMEVLGCPVYDRAGNVVGSLGIHSDITERKKTEENLKRLATFPEQNPNIIIELDLSGDVIYANNKCASEFPDLSVLGKTHPALADFDRVLAEIKQRGDNSLTREIENRDKYYEQKFVYIPSSKIIRTFIYDISEIKNALQLLKESESKFRSLVENSLVGVYLVQDGILKYANPKLAEIFGFKLEDAIDKVRLKDYILPEDWEIVNENLRKRFSGEVHSINYEFRCRTENNEIIFVEAFGSQTTYLNKPAVLGTLLDITNRKKAEEALSEKEKNYRNLINNSADAIYVMQGRHLRLVNPAWEKLFGISAEEAVSEQFDLMTIIAKESIPFVNERLKLVDAGKFKESKYEMKALTRNFGERDLEVNVTEIVWQGKDAIQGIYRDITERKEIENTLRQSEEKYRDLFQYAPVGIYQSTRDGRIITANDQLAIILGYSSTSELMSQNIKDFYVSHDTRENLINEYAPTGSTANLEIQWVRKDKRKIWISLHAHIINNPRIRETIFEGFVRDITDRKKAEMELKKTEIRYRQLIESVSAIFWRADADNFRFKFVSKQAESLLGYPVKSWLEEKDFWINHIHPDDREKAVRLCKESTREGKLHAFDYRMTAANGTVIWLRDIVQVIASEDHPPELIGVMVDMNQQKAIEEELIKARDKAEEANRLKSSFLSTVSHEIRSPLNAILGFSSILKEIYFEQVEEGHRQFFNSMEEAGARLLDTITQVLDISRLEADDFAVNIKPVSVTGAVKSACNVLALQAERKGLDIKLDLPEKDIVIETDEYCLGGVLVNLLSNAIKYSKEGNIKMRLVEKKKHLECSVQDEGIGMSDEYKKHLFETFSQEDVGLSRRYEGTGLGLAITKRYLDLLGGTIEVTSKKNHGTTMTFTLPKK